MRLAAALFVEAALGMSAACPQFVHSHHIVHPRASTEVAGSHSGRQTNCVTLSRCTH
jgi:ABC-type enterobactin transport system permease subunit